jgi:1,4-dihydroxy-2-naphthoate octaprenyltransferase
MTRALDRTLLRRELWLRLLLYPTHTLPTAAAPVLVGMALAWRDGVFAFWPAFVGFLGSWLIHVGGVFLDNHQLLKRHATIDEHPELTAAVADGRLSLRTLALAAASAFLLGIAPAPWLVLRGGWPIVWAGVIGALASYGYAGRGIAYARFGLADPVFFLMFGVLGTFATYHVQAAPHAQPLSLASFLAGLPIGALVVGVLVIDDIRDRDFDARKGWRTPAVRFGLRFARCEFTALLALGYGLPLLYVPLLGFPPLVLLAWLTMPVARSVLRAVWRHDDTASLRPMTPRLARLGAAFAALYALGLAFG